MKVVVIGATGHIGSYLVPELVRLGHRVVAVARGRTLPYTPHMRRYQEVRSKKGTELRPASQGDIDEPEYAEIWKEVEFVQADRCAMGDAFGRQIAQTQADVVCDLICYQQEQARQLIEPCEGNVGQIISIGSVWVITQNFYLPVDERHPRNPKDAYGSGKVEAEAFLLRACRERKICATVIHPGHIVGRGWIPLNPLGNFNIDVFRKIASGERILLPDGGVRTVHHVHAFDVARLIEACIEAPTITNGEAFFSVCARALTQFGYAMEMYRYFGTTAKFDFIEMHRFFDSLSEVDRLQSAEHLLRSPCASMEKARTLLGFEPKFSAMEAVCDALDFLREVGYL